MAFQPGDVVRVWDRNTRPPKLKRLICVDITRPLFLRINSEPRFKPNHSVRASESDFLDHDSFVELRQLVRILAYEIGQAEYLGRLTSTQRVRLVHAVRGARTLSAEHQDLIAEMLGSVPEEPIG